MPPPMAKPPAARKKLTFMSLASSPDRMSFHAAAATADGGGSTVGDIQPSIDEICHDMSSAVGKAHGRTASLGSAIGRRHAAKRDAWVGKVTSVVAVMTRRPGRRFR